MIRKRVVIAGASGFVGAALLERLVLQNPDVQILALSRKERVSQMPQVQWLECDLFSEESILRILPDEIDAAIYLVHSMEATAKLDQGDFADYDLILADNFARVCKVRGVRHLIYLGGLLPEGGGFSKHLASRREVELLFEHYALPCTFFRAGLILGENGSSYQILRKLILRLNVLICPSWTQTRTSPVDLVSVVSALASSVCQMQRIGRTYDLASCRPLTYIEMMKSMAEFLELRRSFIEVPFFSPTISRLWVSLITGASKQLVYPLVESLAHPMLARESHEYFDGKDLAHVSFLDLLRKLPKQKDKVGGGLLIGGLLQGARSTVDRFRRRSESKSPMTVRSIQRLRVPAHFSEEAILPKAVAEYYFAWISKIGLSVVQVQSYTDGYRITLGGKFCLLQLKRDPGQSDENRIVYKIEQGALVAPSKKARLEFRHVLGPTETGERTIVVSIHDYRPRLPWFIYLCTQAQAHLLVMNAFRRRIAR